jgi:ABC-type lipoprotein export system ATPase subunit
MSEPARDAGPALRVVEVVKHYEGGLVKALQGVSFEVHTGESLAITGPSGSGKTTLLHLLGALDRPTSGSVEVMGQDLANISDLARLRCYTLGFVFQMHHLIPNLTLRENVMLPAHPTGVDRKTQRARAAELLTEVGLCHRIDFLPVKCSGGERQRAAIARALINGPQLLLADEPTGSVDTHTGDQIMEMFERMARERSMTTVTITHNHDIAARMGRQLHIVDGLLAQPG